MAEILNKSRLYWIHCNRCFEFYANKKRNFLVLACDHITCESCTEAEPPTTAHGFPSYKCPLCKNSVRGRSMGNNLPPHIKELFHPNPWLDDLPTTRILKFQQTHKARLSEYMKKKRDELLKLQQSTNEIRICAKKRFEQLQIANRERKQLERRVAQITAQRKRNQIQSLLREKVLRMSQLNSSTDTSGMDSVKFIPPQHSVRNRRAKFYSTGGASALPMANTSADVQSFVSKRDCSFDL